MKRYASFYLSDNVISQIKDNAEDEGISQSAFVTRSIIYWLQRHNNDLSAQHREWYERSARHAL